MLAYCMRMLASHLLPRSFRFGLFVQMKSFVF